MSHSAYLGLNRQNDHVLRSYYANRATEYDQVYLKPERQTDLRTLRKLISNSFVDADVLEVACGTGYWTQLIAPLAKSVVAVDAVYETIQIAKHRQKNRRVNFVQSDAYRLPLKLFRFDASFVGFWLSHIPVQMQSGFVNQLSSHLAEGAKVTVVDNLYVEGSSSPIALHDCDGNTFQMRYLNDGSSYQVLKNFPSERYLLQLVSGLADNLTYTKLSYYWVFQFDIRR